MSTNPKEQKETLPDEVTADSAPHIDTQIELEAYKQKSENALMGRKIVVTYISLFLVSAMAVIANYMPVVKELYGEVSSTIILLSLTMVSGNVAATFVERKFSK